MPWSHTGDWRYNSTYLDLGNRWSNNEVILKREIWGSKGSNCAVGRPHSLAEVTCVAGASICLPGFLYEPEDGDSTILWIFIRLHGVTSHNAVLLILKSSVRVDWIHLDQQRDQRWNLVTMATNLQVPYNSKNLHTTWATISLLRQSLLYGVS
jgi:hypothetical protein